MDAVVLGNIKNAAEKFIESFADQNLGYNEESVAWADGVVERQRVRPDIEDFTGLSNVIGCFLGESIRINFGGEWQSTEHGFALVLGDGNSCFPLNKAGKHFANGADDSILSFYKTIPVLFKHLNFRRRADAD
jgi:hypothetical protein